MKRKTREKRKRKKIVEEIRQDEREKIREEERTKIMKEMKRKKHVFRTDKKKNYLICMHVNLRMYFLTLTKRHGELFLSRNDCE